MRHCRSTCSIGCPNPKSVPSDNVATNSANRTGDREWAWSIGPLLGDAIRHSKVSRGNFTRGDFAVTPLDSDNSCRLHRTFCSHAMMEPKFLLLVHGCCTLRALCPRSFFWSTPSKFVRRSDVH